MSGWSAGNFTRGNGVNSGSDTWAQDKAASTKILASRHDTHDQILADGINNCIAKDGQNAATANLPMGGYLHSGVGNASARDNYAAANQVQDGSFHYAVPSGTGDAITLTLVPAITAYTAGQSFKFVAQNTNTGATTLNVNGLGAKNIRHAFNSNIVLVGGSIVVGQVCHVVYDGARFRLLSPLSPCIDKVQSTVTASNTTAETTIYTYTVPALTIGKFNLLRLSLYGDVYNNTGGVTLCTFRLKFGGTTIASVTNASISTSSNRAIWRLSTLIEGLDASVQRNSSEFQLTTTAADTGTLTTSNNQYIAGYTNGAADSTVGNDLVFTAQMSSATANFEVRTLGGLLEVL
jgi:hypothetical protein